MLVSIGAAKLTEGQDVTELIAQLMLYPSSHILTASKLFTDWFCFEFNQQAWKCFSTTTLLRSKANSRLLSCPCVPLHHLFLLCWCSCLWGNIENQQRYSANKAGFRGCGGWGFFNNEVSPLSHVTSWFCALLWQQLYWHRLCGFNEQPK